MRLTFLTVVFDADDPPRAAQFWAAALERDIAESDPEWATLAGEPRIDFMKVPEGKIVKNRLHLDWYAPEREAEIDRLMGLGATRLQDVKNEDFEWTTLADVEGNEFCVVQLGVGAGWSQPELRARIEAVGQPSAAPGNS